MMINQDKETIQKQVMTIILNQWFLKMTKQPCSVGRPKSFQKFKVKIEPAWVAEFILLECHKKI